MKKGKEKLNRTDNSTWNTSTKIWHTESKGIRGGKWYTKQPAQKETKMKKKTTKNKNYETYKRHT